MKASFKALSENQYMYAVVILYTVTWIFSAVTVSHCFDLYAENLVIEDENDTVFLWQNFEISMAEEEKRILTPTKMLNRSSMSSITIILY